MQWLTQYIHSPAIALVQKADHLLSEGEHTFIMFINLDKMLSIATDNTWHINSNWIARYGEPYCRHLLDLHNVQRANSSHGSGQRWQRVSSSSNELLRTSLLAIFSKSEICFETSTWRSFWKEYIPFIRLINFDPMLSAATDNTWHINSNCATCRGQIGGSY